MKKILVFLLSMVLICSSVLLLACNDAVTGIKFKEDTLPKNVKQGDTINYDSIVIIATFEGGNTKEVKLTDKGVTVQKIDTSTTGNKVLSVEYMGQKAQANINVTAKDVVGEITITGFVNTKGYLNYEEAKAEKTNKEEEFYNRDAVYEVGNVNGYVLMPTVSGLDAEDNEFDQLPDLKTTYVLYVKNGGSFVKVEQANLETYLSKVENNVYYFTEDAIDREFKLEVTLDDSYEILDEKMSKTITQEFKVVEGYNVYDALGLSVLDNLNNISWADIKNTQLAWDDKKLSEYGNVKQVILHNNITLKKSDLPANYFWTKNEAAKGEGVSYADALSRAPEQLKPLLEGSLKETCLGEVWENGSGSKQRGLFTSTGIGLSGNYLKLSYETGLVIASEDKDAEVTAPNGGIYVVHDYTQEAGEAITYPESHTSFIAYRNPDKSAKISANISNVYFVGQTQKTENTKIPAGIMMAMTDIGEISYNNIIAQRWFANVMVDDYFADANISECKFYNSFSHMIYAWYANKINVTHSELKNAGGPLFILQSNVIHSGNVLGNGTTDVELKVSVDNYSMEHMESWLTGDEVWFKINVPEATSIIPQLFGLAAPLDTSLGKHYVQKEGSGDNVITKYNVLMVVIPNPSKVFSNQEPLVGDLTFDGQKYDMDDAVLTLTGQLPSVAGELVALIESLPEQAQGLMSALKTGAQGLQSQTAALPIAPIYKSGNNYGYTDTHTVNFSDIIAGLKQLQAGALQAASKLEEYGMGSYAPNFTAWAAKVNPIASLVNVQAEPTDDNYGAAVDAAWKEGWANAPKFVALWVNPGGLDAKNPNFNLKPFMVVFGENTQAQ